MNTATTSKLDWEYSQSVIETVWKKCPSVTMGGKPFFHTAVKGNTRYWVVWDRKSKTWIIEDSHGAVWGDFDCPKTAMEAVERL